jgi:hypothetical protein
MKHALGVATDRLFSFQEMIMTPRNMAFVAAAVLAIAPNASIRAGGQQNMQLPSLPDPYRTVADFVTMPAGRVMGSTNAINVDAKGNIWIFERCGANSCTNSDVDPILEFDSSSRTP